MEPGSITVYNYNDHVEYKALGCIGREVYVLKCWHFLYIHTRFCTCNHPQSFDLTTGSSETLTTLKY